MASEKTTNQRIAENENKVDPPNKIRGFMTVAMLLGGERARIGMDRLMNGLCPDCGTDNHNCLERCFNWVDETEDDDEG